MELYAMLYQRLTSSDELSMLLANYGGSPAIFYQRPPTADDTEWGDRQYPRIDYIVDMQENPSRNTSGILTVNVWCDTEYGAEPEDIEPKLRELLHATFVQADDYPYCFAWVRSDSFEVKTQADENVRTIGVTVIFDIMAFPCQYTMYPDPIKAMNLWTKGVLPDATVIGEDEIDGWLSPTREKPVIYWHLTAQSVHQKHFTHTWLNISIEGFVFAKSASDRLYNIARINTAHALAGHIPMEDTSPLFLRDFSIKPHMNYLSQGQIQANGRFGILQTAAHFENKSTGSKLNRINIPREIIDADTSDVVLDSGQTQPFVFPYEVSGQQESGTHPGNSEAE